MNEVTNPVEGAAESTAPANDAVNDLFNGNLDQGLGDAFEHAFDGIDLAPSEKQVQQPQVDQVSEEEELIPSDDDSNINEDDGEEVEIEEDGDDTVEFEVISSKDFAEQGFKWDYKGKSYSANDIDAALGRQSKQEEARKEVETAQAELEAERKAIEAQRAQVELSQSSIAEQQKLAQLQNAYGDLVKQRDEALNNNDSHNLSLINARLQQVQQAYGQVQTEINNNRQQQAAYAASQLAKFGFGDINTDEQRRQSFVDYANSNIPSNLLNVIDTSPELLAIVEKARLFDKGQTSVSKGKLKPTTKRTLKGRAGKSPVSKKPQSNLDRATDAVFESMIEDGMFKS